MAAREGPGQGGQARRPRERAGCGQRRGRRRRRRHRRAQVRDRLLGQVRRLHRDSSRTSPSSWPPRAPTPSASVGTSSTPEDRQEGEHRAGHGRPVRDQADGNLLDSYLHLQDGRGVNAVLVELRRWRRSWRTTSPSTSPSQAPLPAHATRSPADASSRSASPRCSTSPRPRASPTGLAQDRRGPPERLVQGPGAARAGLRPRRHILNLQGFQTGNEGTSK